VPYVRARRSVRLPPRPCRVLDYCSARKRPTSGTISGSRLSSAPPWSESPLMHGVCRTGVNFVPPRPPWNRCFFVADHDSGEVVASQAFCESSSACRRHCSSTRVPGRSIPLIGVSWAGRLFHRDGSYRSLLNGATPELPFVLGTDSAFLFPGGDSGVESGILVVVVIGSDDRAPVNCQLTRSLLSN